jgi:hypothetical protein
MKEEERLVSSDQGDREQEVIDQMSDPIAPAIVQHMARFLSTKTKSNVEWKQDPDADTWSIHLGGEIECCDSLHTLLAKKTGESYDNCTAGHHDLKAEIKYRRVGKKSSNRWKGKTRVWFDNTLLEGVDSNKIFSLLAKPTNPLGEGKVSSKADGSNKQTMSVKKSTVIRV